MKRRTKRILCLVIAIVLTIAMILPMAVSVLM